MKRLLALVLVICMLCLAACENTTAPETNVSESDMLDAVQTESSATETDSAICLHETTKTEEQKPLILADGYTKVICTDCGSVISNQTVPATLSFKILAIGNSFSVDATTHLWSILNACGVKELIVGNAQIGGCSLDKHWQMAQSGEAAYSYTKYTADGKKTVKVPLLDAVTDEQWDVITLQQVSQHSGRPSQYTHLDDMIDYVLTNCINPEAEIYFHMTWAYQQDTTSTAFSKYYKQDQMTMYNAIVDTMQSTVLKNERISGIIPSGTAVQNLRTSYIGDTVTRDGTHMSYLHGRYITALVWACYFTGLSPYDVDHVPSAVAQVKDDMDAVREAVYNALKTPFAVTSSTVHGRKELTLEDRFSDAGLNFNSYELLDWSPLLHSYWVSTSKVGITSKETSTATNLPYYISSRKLTKEDLPVGSVIVVDEGYQYRPEGWQTADKKNTSARPDNSTSIFTVIDEAWWADYTVRAFNLSYIKSSTVITEADAVHLKIYVPKK